MGSGDYGRRERGELTVRVCVCVCVWVQRVQWGVLWRGCAGPAGAGHAVCSQVSEVPYCGIWRRTVEPVYAAVRAYTGGAGAGGVHAHLAGDGTTGRAARPGGTHNAHTADGQYTYTSATQHIPTYNPLSCQQPGDRLPAGAAEGVPALVASSRRPSC